MAVTRQGGNSITFSAVNESTQLGADLLDLRGLTFRGTGLTAAQRLLVTDEAGNYLADYAIEAATDNADLWGSKAPRAVGRIMITNNAVDGSWVLTAFV
jgi:hypothetical protein